MSPNHLCRWQQGCVENYIRATRLLIEGAQEKIASAIKAGRGARDFLDEGNLWEQLLWKFGDELGTSFLDEQVSRLRFFGEGLATPRLVEPPVHSPTGALAVELQVPIEMRELDAEVLSSLDEGTGEARALSETAETISLATADSLADGGTESDSSEGENTSLAPMLILQKYFVSTTGSARKRRLHLRGA